MEQYRLLADCFLPEEILNQFELKDVHVEITDGEKVIHIYLDENDAPPEPGQFLRPNGFTRECIFHDFPIRGHEALLHIRRRRWLDAGGHNVMKDCRLIQEFTRCSAELADFLKEAFG